MVDWAAYMESADIDKIDSIAVADLNDDTGIELAHVYNLNKVGLKNFERLVEKHGILMVKIRFDDEFIAYLLKLKW